MNGKVLAKIRLPITTFLPILWWAIPAVFVPVSIVGAFETGDLDQTLIACSAAAAGVTPVLLAICLVCALTYHVRVYGDGVSSYDPWGSWKKDFLGWSDMRQISVVSVIGVRYFKIDGENESALWIPARVFEAERFGTEIQRTASGSKICEWISDASMR